MLTNLFFRRGKSVAGKASRPQSQRQLRRRGRAFHKPVYLPEPLEMRRLLSLTVPAYSSLPGAAKQIFLDFDGNAAFTWNNADGHGNYTAHGAGAASTAIPGFTNDSDANNFSSGELTEIQSIWAWVSEKYSPFNVNVTTVDPGNRNNNVVEQCIIGGSDTDWYNGNAGGVSAIGGFANGSLPNNCFVFSGDVMSNSSKSRIHFLGDSIAHEVAHSMGLVHERSPGNEYYNGDTTRAPIMGNSSNAKDTVKGIWWKTNNWAGQNSTDPGQDELYIMSTIGPMPGRSDDYPSPSSLTLNGNGTYATKTGIIEVGNDADGFNFSPPVSAVSFTVDNAGASGMLTPQVFIYDVSAGVVAAGSTITNTSTRATISNSSLTTGHVYRLVVNGNGQYGDLGQYTVNGTATQFATLSGGILNVSGSPGNNNITLSIMFNGTGNPGLLKVTDSVNGGPIGSQTYDLTLINQVNVLLSSGNDKVNIQPLHPLYGGGTGPLVVYDGAGGNNTLILDKFDDDTAAFNVDRTGLIELSSTEVFIHGGAQNVQLLGSLSDNQFNIHSWDGGSNSALYCTGFGGHTDTFTFDSYASGGDYGSITLDGAGGNDTLNFDASYVTGSQQFNFFGTELTSGSGQFVVDFTSIETVNVYSGSAADGMGVYAEDSATTLNFHGGGGNDNLFVGDSSDGIDVSGILGAIYFYGDGGTDSAYLDDIAATSSRIYIADHTHIAAYLYTVNNVAIYGGTIFNGGSVESLTIDGSDAVGSTYYVYEGQPGGTLILYGGSSSDSFNLNAGTYWNTYVYGNGGIDSMIVDDRGGASEPFRTEIRDVNVTHSFGSFSAFTTYTITYVGIESPSYYGAPSTTQLSVLSTSTLPAGHQWNVFTNSGNDTIYVYPHNTATGAATILGAVVINGGGGTDTIIFDDSATPLGVTYDFGNPFGASTCQIALLGPALIGFGNDVENAIINGGPLADYFRFDSFQSGTALTINGNGGNDICDITPFSKDVATNITNVASFNFVGGLGSDSLRFFNDSAAVAWTYIQTSTYFEGLKSAGGYTLFLQDSGVETIYASGTALVDTINVNSMPAGAVFQVTGGAGLDIVTLSAGPVEFPVAQDLASLTIAAGVTAKMTGVHDGLRVTSTLSVSGKLDLYHSDLIQDYSGAASPLGTWNGSTYTGTAGLLRTGRNGGAWNGTSGIVTTGATGNLTSLGVAEASQAFGLTTTQTKLFDGYTVDSTTVLVKYTYGGDANIDGKINVDDYTRIDFNVPLGTKGWFNGDYNYDGKINVDDYTIIDFNVGIQGAPLLSGSSAGTTLVSTKAVPFAIATAPALKDDELSTERVDALDLLE